MSVSRNNRRLAKKMKEKVMKTEETDVKKAFVLLVDGMLQDGPSILASLKEAAGCEPTPGHAIDGIMRAAAFMGDATLRCDAPAALKAAVTILYLARVVAISQGVIKTEELPEAPKC